MTLAVMQVGREIATIEGLAADGALDAVQASFIEHDAFQCGFCTSGQIMSAVACIREGHARTRDDIRQWMSGNICRCGAYPNIVAAVEAAAREGAFRSKLEEPPSQASASLAVAESGGRGRPRQETM